MRCWSFHSGSPLRARSPRRRREAVHPEPGPRPAAGERCGSALLLAIVTLGVLGALVAGVFAAALLESRAGSIAVRRVRVFTAAELGLYRVLAPGGWSPLWSTSPSPGLLERRVYLVGEGVVDTVSIWKLTPASALVVSAAVSGAGPALARRRLTLLMALERPLFAPPAALVVRDSLVIRDASSVSGADTALAAWGCASAEAALPGVAVADSSAVHLQACAGGCLVGGPPVLVTPRVTNEALYTQFGPVDRAALVERAASLPAGATLRSPGPARSPDGACDTTNPANLGDPLGLLGPGSPCAAYFPVRSVAGDLHLVGGVAQGLFLVEGDLTLESGAQLFGLVIADGSVVLTGGSRVTGAVLARRAVLEARSAIRSSRCAVTRALQGAAVPIVPRGLTWAELY